VEIRGSGEVRGLVGVWMSEGSKRLSGCHRERRDLVDVRGSVEVRCPLPSGSQRLSGSQKVGGSVETRGILEVRGSGI
jgi:hypothetical protein